MIKNRSELARRSIEIDLSSSQGNAFFLLGTAKRLCSQLGKNWEEIEKEMTSGDYENLLSVLEREFGDHIVLYR